MTGGVGVKKVPKQKMFIKISESNTCMPERRRLRAKMFIKISESNTCMPEWRRLRAKMFTKICQSSRISISPYFVYHDIIYMRTDWSDIGSERL